MQDALRFFQDFEVWIYLLLGLVGIFYLRKFLSAWHELRGAVFGLERENAQGRLNQAASLLIFVFSLMVAEFLLVSFVVPAMPDAAPLFTPTLNLLATPTIALEVGLPGQTADLATVLQETPPLATLSELSPANQCLEGQIFISSPQNGASVSGIVEVSGSANIENFGFYKLEMRRVDEQEWLTILAGNQIQPDGLLGTWNTALLSPALYHLRLVVVDNQGVALPPCEIQLNIAADSGTPQP
ncbi:MAG: hypothetical protein Kow0088_21770 [Anaerolineales bacterium]